MNEQDIEKVQMYFEAALAVPSEKRTDFLAELCGKETDICHKVQSLLEADLQTKVWDSNNLFNTAIKKPVGFQAGDEIGPHRIVGQIGEGGMGVIYKALDTRLERHVALKFLPTSMNTDAQIRQRFLAEARAASRLDHPNICVIHDVGETPDGQMFITMPCYEGETLTKRISRGPLPHMEAVDIALQVGEGLASAHAHNIVHRDIKPSNIMLTKDGGIKVLDFGIAKVENIHLTSTGVSIGTLAYMSPEQLRGEQVDARTDVWALGVVLFEMLNGKQAFPAKALADILQSVLHDVDKTLESLTVDLPEQLYQVLQSSMARDLQQRYVDMPTMINALINARAALNNNDTSIQITSFGSSNNKKSRSYEWDNLVLDIIAKLLLSHLGPIAPTLVRRMSKTASDLVELGHCLAEYLPDQTSRDNFYKQMEAQIAEFTSPPAPRTLKTDGSLDGVELSATQLAEIESALIPHLGPIAQTMIKRHAVNASSIQGLCESLSDHLDNKDVKKAFLQQMNQLFET